MEYFYTVTLSPVTVLEGLNAMAFWTTALCLSSSSRCYGLLQVTSEWRELRHPMQVQTDVPPGEQSTFRGVETLLATWVASRPRSVLLKIRLKSLRRGIIHYTPSPTATKCPLYRSTFSRENSASEVTRMECLPVFSSEILFIFSDPLLDMRGSLTRMNDSVTGHTAPNSLDGRCWLTNKCKGCHRAEIAGGALSGAVCRSLQKKRSWFWRGE